MSEEMQVDFLHIDPNLSSTSTDVPRTWSSSESWFTCISYREVGTSGITSISAIEPLSLSAQFGTQDGKFISTVSFRQPMPARTNSFIPSPQLIVDRQHSQ